MSLSRLPLSDEHVPSTAALPRQEGAAANVRMTLAVNSLSQCGKNSSVGSVTGFTSASSKLRTCRLPTNSAARMYPWGIRSHCAQLRLHSAFQILYLCVTFITNKKMYS